MTRVEDEKEVFAHRSILLVFQTRRSLFGEEQVDIDARCFFVNQLVNFELEAICELESPFSISEYRLQINFGSARAGDDEHDLVVRVKDTRRFNHAGYF